MQVVVGLDAAQGPDGPLAARPEQLPLVGILGDHTTGAIGNIGDTVTVLMIIQIPALYLVWRYMPETKGRELEEISA